MGDAVDVGGDALDTPIMGFTQILHALRRRRCEMLYSYHEK
jgi:hypothetical protein